MKKNKTKKRKRKMFINAQEALTKSKLAKMKMDEFDAAAKIARANSYRQIFALKIEEAIEKGETSFLRAFDFDEIDFIEQNGIISELTRAGYNVSIETCGKGIKQYFVSWNNIKLEKDLPK